MIIVTIPAFNEEKTIGPVIDEIKTVMNKIQKKYKILVVNDGSSDTTTQVAKKHGAIVHEHKRNQGLHKTFQTEMQQCIKLKADIIVHTDADGQYPAEFIPHLIAEMENGYDLVLGSRFRKHKSRHSLTKNLGNRAFAKVFSHILGQKITDTTTGFRAFTREVAENIPITSNFTYTQEQLIRAAKKKYKIKEISIQMRSTRDSRLFSSPLQYAWKAWINIFRIYRDYNPLQFFGTIGGALFGAGFFLGLFFTVLHFTAGIVGHVPLLILTMLLLLTGIQIILFGFLADMK